MLAKRIIPCLDVTGGRVVKGVNFVNLRDAGDPVELADRYNRDGADELVRLRLYVALETAGHSSTAPDQELLEVPFNGAAEAAWLEAHPAPAMAASRAILSDPRHH